MTKDGYMIRPTYEVICRLVNPEHEVNTIGENLRNIETALYNNYQNVLTRNKLKFYYYDALLQKYNK